MNMGVLRAWWATLQQREQLTLLAGASLGGLVLLYVAIWEPLVAQRHALRDQVQTLRGEVLWMRQSAARVRALEGVQSDPVPSSRQGSSLLTLVDQSARRAGLGEALQRLEPQGDGGLRVQFEAVSFDRLVLWIGELRQRYQVSIVNGIMDRQSSGRVNARLVLQDQRS